jgi:hypothetical protein
MTINWYVLTGLRLLSKSKFEYVFFELYVVAQVAYKCGWLASSLLVMELLRSTVSRLNMIMGAMILPFLSL